MFQLIDLLVDVLEKYKPWNNSEILCCGVAQSTWTLHRQNMQKHWYIKTTKLFHLYLIDKLIYECNTEVFTRKTQMN